MPKEWHDRHTVNKMPDGDTKDLYRSIVADKKPYFMRYIYPALMKQYNTYVKNTDRNALREFQMTIAELQQLPIAEATERQLEFLRYYNYRMPVGMHDCVMNKICRRFEDEFEGYIGKHNKAIKFDYTIMKSSDEYTPRQYAAIRKLYEDYNKRLQSYSIFADYERIDECDSAGTMNMMNSEFRKECDKICPNEKVLCNIILDICYNKSSTKKFAWSMCGTQIIHNLLEHNNNTISYPVLDDNGDICFGGLQYTTKSKQIGVNE